MVAVPIYQPPTPLSHRNLQTYQDKRNAYDIELWDDLSNSVYFNFGNPGTAVGAGANATVLSTTVGTPIACRYEIDGQGVLDCAATTNNFMRIKVDNVIQTSAISRFVIGAAANVTHHITMAVDVIGGLHTIALYFQSVAGAFTIDDVSLTVRRGRKPTV